MLETIPFDDNIVQFYGSYTQHGNILLVLEYMQVTTAPHSCKTTKNDNTCCLHKSAVGPFMQFDRHVMLCNLVGHVQAEFC